MARFTRGGKLLTVAALALLEAAVLREPPRAVGQEAAAPKAPAAPPAAAPMAPAIDQDQERPRDGLRRLFS
jgi:hypothetical protein